MRCHMCGRFIWPFTRVRFVQNLSTNTAYTFHGKCRRPWLDEWKLSGDNSVLFAVGDDL